MAGRKRTAQDLDVWMNGERVGRWTVSAAAGHSFTYAESWLASGNARQLSLTMPLAQGTAPFKGEVVRAWFENLLPDSANIRRRLESRYRTPANSALHLLAEIGRDCTGAVQLLRPDSEQADVRRIDAEPLNEAGVAQCIDQALAGRAIQNLPDDDELRISIAGAQEKTALLLHDGQWCLPRGTTPTTHILKLPMGLVGNRQADFSTSVENEWLCNRLFREFGLPVPNCELSWFRGERTDHKVLIVERFDRKLVKDATEWWARLPQEDFCQATGTAPEKKYEADGGPGMAEILDLLRGSVSASKDREQFLMAQLLFWMLAAPDGHAKNFSVHLEAGGAFQLTPFYDVMSAWPVVGSGPNQIDLHKVQLAMRVRGENSHYRIEDIQRRHWNAMAKRNGLGEDFEAVMGRVIEQTDAVVDAVSQRLPDDIPAEVADAIFSGLKRQAHRLGGMPRI